MTGGPRRTAAAPIGPARVQVSRDPAGPGFPALSPNPPGATLVFGWPNHLRTPPGWFDPPLLLSTASRQCQDRGAGTARATIHQRRLR